MGLVDLPAGAELTKFLKETGETVVKQKHF